MAEHMIFMLSVTPQLTARDALRAIRRCARTIDWGRKNPVKGLEIIAPFHSCTTFPDLSPESSRKTLSLVCAVTADCHRELGDHLTAADWYRRAAHYYEGGGFPYFYAELVLSHNLAEHYQTALDCVTFSQSEWHQHQWALRMLAHLVSLWWLRPSMRSFMRRHKSFASELSSRLESTNGL